MILTSLYNLLLTSIFIWLEEYITDRYPWEWRFIYLIIVYLSCRWHWWSCCTSWGRRWWWWVCTHTWSCIGSTGIDVSPWSWYIQGNHLRLRLYIRRILILVGQIIEDIGHIGNLSIDFIGVCLELPHILTHLVLLQVLILFLDVSHHLLGSVDQIAELVEHRCILLTVQHSPELTHLSLHPSLNICVWLVASPIPTSFLPQVLLHLSQSSLSAFLKLDLDISLPFLLLFLDSFSLTLEALCIDGSLSFKLDC